MRRKRLTQRDPVVDVPNVSVRWCAYRMLAFWINLGFVFFFFFFLSLGINSLYIFYFP